MVERILAGAPQSIPGTNSIVRKNQVNTIASDKAVFALSADEYEKA
ncbi:hypothetical protein [Paenibacillus sp. HB172176]|nr:hypothetical protein [Paenibacillus sp. HB172176]